VPKTGLPAATAAANARARTGDLRQSERCVGWRGISFMGSVNWEAESAVTCPHRRIIEHHHIDAQRHRHRLWPSFWDRLRISVGSIKWRRPRPWRCESLTGDRFSVDLQPEKGLFCAYVVFSTLHVPSCATLSRYVSKIVLPDCVRYECGPVEIGMLQAGHQFIYSQILERLQSTKRHVSYLDYGCEESGLVLSYIAQRINGTVVGFNIPFNTAFPSTIRHHGGNQLFVSNPTASRQLPFDDGSFDFVSSVNILEHAADVSFYIREAHRVLKPSGQLYVFYEPSWSSAKGHHIYDVMLPGRFGLAQDAPGFVSPYKNDGTFIADFSHLLLRELEFFAAMKEKSFAPDTVLERITSFVFREGELNRNFWDATDKILMGFGWEVLSRRCEGKSPEASVLQRLLVMHGNFSYNCWRSIYDLRK
jgi:SAM-dependent methyltransferase